MPGPFDATFSSEFGGVEAVPASGVGWSTTDKANITVSGANNLTATGTGSGGTVRSATTHATGKYYAELTLSGAVNTTTHMVWGLANAAYNLFSYPGAGSPSNSIGIDPGDQQEIWYNNVWSGWQTPPGPSSAGHVISICCDLTFGAVWFLTPTYISLYGANAWNANPASNPVTGIGAVNIAFPGPFYLAFYGLAAGGSGTLNTGGSAFVRTPPSGFVAWDSWTSAQAGTASYAGAGSLIATPIQRRPMVGKATIAPVIAGSLNPFAAEFSSEFNDSLLTGSPGFSAKGTLTTSPGSMTGVGRLGPMAGKGAMTMPSGIVGIGRLGPVTLLGISSQSDRAAGLSSISPMTSLITATQAASIGIGIGRLGPLVGKGTMTGAVITASGVITLGPVRPAITLASLGGGIGRSTIGSVTVSAAATTANTARAVVRLGPVVARAVAVAGNGARGLATIGPLRIGGRATTRTYGPKTRDTLLIPGTNP